MIILQVDRIKTLLTACVKIRQHRFWKPPTLCLAAARWHYLSLKEEEEGGSIWRP